MLKKALAVFAISTALLGAFADSSYADIDEPRKGLSKPYEDTNPFPEGLSGVRPGETGVAVLLGPCAFVCVLR